MELIITDDCSMDGSRAIAEEWAPVDDGVVPVLRAMNRGLAAAGRIFNFSLGLYSGTIVNAVRSRIERLYLARLVGVVPVGWYARASGGASKIRRLPDLLLGPVMAAASEHHVGHERRKISQLYFRSHKYIAATAVPLAVFAAAASKALVTLWLGPKLSFISFPFALLVLGNLFLQAGAPIYFVLVGRGVLRSSIYAALITSVLNVVFSLVFIARWGFMGAAGSSVLAIVIGNVYYFSATQRYFEIRFVAVLRRAYLKPALCSLAAAAAMCSMDMARLRPWPGLFAGAATYSTVYVIGLIVTRFFDEYDFSKLGAHLPMVARVRRAMPISLGLEN